LLKEILKERALSIVQIPPDYKPIIEDFIGDGQGWGEAFFTWGNEERDEHISITLNHLGQLIDLTIDKEVEEETISPINVEQKRSIAEEFLGEHYPDAMKFFTLTRVKNRPQEDIFYFEQLVMNLPLQNAGCRINVDHQGNVTGFIYHGIKDIPNLPKTIIEKEKLIADVEQRLDFQLKIVQRNDKDYRLVYQPTASCMDYKAEALEPSYIYEAIEEENGPHEVLPIPIHQPTEQKPPASIEEIIGIGDEMEIIREKDLGDERGIVWRRKNWVAKGNDYTLDAFFANKNEDTVKAFIDKETRQVTRFLWFYERKGELCLTREECFKIAIDFLYRIIPGYCPYLQQEVLKEYEEEENEPTRLERFMFSLYRDQNLPVESGYVMVGVNVTTGQIDYYEGPRIPLHQLENIPSKPVISKDQAREQFLKHLDFKLAWQYDYDTQSQFLVYEACNCDTQTPIGYVDALTGEVMTSAFASA